MKQLFIEETCVEVTDDDVVSVLSSKINDLPEVCDAIVVGDLGDIVAKHCSWRECLSRVEPFYVVKCNDDPAALSILAQLGTGFVCYNKAEMHKILKLEVPSSRILYGNPCKPSSHLQYAVQQDVRLLTFESEAELRKLNCKHRSAKLLLRINPLADDYASADGLSFGCHPQDVPQLLNLARQLQADIIGISVHLGETVNSLSAVCDAVEMARVVFELASEIGFNLTILDIGGDCIGKLSARFCFEKVAAVLNSALDQSFSDHNGVRVILECGQFFVESAFTVAVDVMDQRIEICDTEHYSPDDTEACGSESFSSVYFVSDGVYGCFSRLLLEPVIMEPIVINRHEEQRFLSSIWGPTYDSLDCIVTNCMLPKLNVGDWLAFRGMGAFLTKSSNLQMGVRCNVERVYIIQERRWLQLCLAAESKSFAGELYWNDDHYNDYERLDI